MPGARRAEVTVGGTTALSLVTWIESMPAGCVPGLVFRSGSLQADHDRLVAVEWSLTGCRSLRQNASSGAEQVPAAEHAQRGKCRGQGDRDHDRRGGGPQRLPGHEPDVRERRQADPSGCVRHYPQQP
jgi:hypothetical protein